MKADGGALIYIIIAVISLIVSAVSKSKKKALQQNTPKPSSSEPAAPQQPQQTTWQKELEDIFGKVLTEPEVVVKKPEYVEPKPVVAREVKPQKVTLSDERMNYYTDKAASKPTNQLKSEPSVVIRSEEEEHAMAGINIDEFELNKAVIYSEILNRKYF